MRPQTQYKLEYKLLYSCVVAGKSAKFAEAVMARFLPKDLMDPRIGLTPFDIVRLGVYDGSLRNRLILSRSGNYTKLERAFKAIVGALYIDQYRNFL
jgi:hypothetical protein